MHFLDEKTNSCKTCCTVGDKSAQTRHISSPAAVTLSSKKHGSDKERRLPHLLEASKLQVCVRVEGTEHSFSTDYFISSFLTSKYYFKLNHAAFQDLWYSARATMNRTRKYSSSTIYADKTYTSCEVQPGRWKIGRGVWHGRNTADRQL